MRTEAIVFTGVVGDEAVKGFREDELEDGSIVRAHDEALVDLVKDLRKEERERV